MSATNSRHNFTTDAKWLTTDYETHTQYSFIYIWFTYQSAPTQLATSHFLGLQMKTKNYLLALYDLWQVAISTFPPDSQYPIPASGQKTWKLDKTVNPKSFPENNSEIVRIEWWFLFLFVMFSFSLHFHLFFWVSFSFSFTLAARRCETRWVVELIHPRSTEHSFRLMELSLVHLHNLAYNHCNN